MKNLEIRSNLSLEEKTKVVKGNNVLARARIKQVELAIPSAYEEAKTSEHLRSTIMGLDFQSLKKIDAVMRRHREIPTTRKETTSIGPLDLSDKAVDLYVALVKEVYTITVRNCSSSYSLRELNQVGDNLAEFNQASTSSPDKSKKFYAAEKAMNELKDINKGVIDRITKEVQGTKTLSK